MLIIVQNGRIWLNRFWCVSPTKSQVRIGKWYTLSEGLIKSRHFFSPTAKSNTDSTVPVPCGNSETTGSVCKTVQLLLLENRINASRGSNLSRLLTYKLIRRFRLNKNPTGKPDQCLLFLRKVTRDVTRMIRLRNKSINSRYEF
jgi:hypothetical protein